MKMGLRNLLCVILTVCLLILSEQGAAQYYFELTPGVSVGEMYDDNIDLDSTDEESDYITTVSPSLSLAVLSDRTRLGLAYAPTFVWYERNNENNTVRHTGTVTLSQNMTERWTFDLTDTYLKSEEPIEETEDVEGVRRTRDTYQRNTATAGFSYLFGPEDTVTAGYRHHWLKNDDPSVDDGTIQTPFVSLMYWLNVKDGLELDYEHTKADFSRDDDLEPEDDYTGHMWGLGYLRRFSPHTTGFAGYRFTTRNFDGTTEDYDVHEGAIGCEQAFSPDLFASLSVGYFVQENERSEDRDGYTYDATLVKRFERGSLTIEGSGGWDEAYLEAEERGFTKYWSVVTSLEYQVLEPLNCYGGWSYRHDEDNQGREWRTWRRSFGVRWTFLRWYSLSLDYTRSNRKDDDYWEDYTVNRVMLVLTASKLYRW